ncbi:MAG: zf-HC2 domain-containing protein [Anaerotignum sp.]|nr:zf-HC2 domain-containing protein [Anaerotignum sp.]
MNCETVKEMLWAYLEKETTAEEAVKIEEHLKNCAVCREELELQKEIMDSLQNLPDEELPDGFHANLMQKLQVEAAPNVVPFPVKKKKAPVYKQWGMIAAAVMVVVAAGGMNGMLGMRDAQNAAVQEMQKVDTVEVAEYAAEDMAAEEGSKDKLLMKANTADLKKTAAPAAGAAVASAMAEDTFAVYDGVVTEEVEDTESFSMTRSVEVKMTDAVVLAVTDTMQAKETLQNLIIAVGGYEETTASEDCMIAVIPAEEFEAFTEKMENIGSLEWTQKGSEETGAAWRTVEIQLYKK